MDIKELKKLIDFLRENGVSEFESNEDGKHIKISLADFKENVVYNTNARQEVVKNEVKSLRNDDIPMPTEDTTDFTVVKSPIVGTFYSKPSPTSETFVNLGDKVRKGQVLCIIEAMKVMNEIESPCDGVIQEICVNDAEIVEFSQPLFKIK